MNRKLNNYLFNMIEGILGAYEDYFYPHQYMNGDLIDKDVMNKLEEAMDFVKNTENPVELRDVLISLLPSKGLYRISNLSTNQQILQELNLLGYYDDVYDMKPYSDYMDIRDGQPINSIRLLVKNDENNGLISLTAVLDDITGNFQVDWGDGSEIETFNNKITATHTFTSGTSIPGKDGILYNMVTIYSDNYEIVGYEAKESVNIVWCRLNGIDFKGDGSIVLGKDPASKANYEGIRFLNCTVNNITDMSGLFQGCKKVKVLNLSDWTCDNLVNCSSAFEDCESLEALIMKTHCMGKVANFDNGFKNCKKLVLRQSEWNIANARSFNSTFEGCESLVSFPLTLPPLTTSTRNMFKGCISLTTPPVTEFPSNLTDTTGMYEGCINLTTDVTLAPTITTADYMFKDCINLKNIHSNWNVEYPNGLSNVGFYEGCNNISAIDGKNVIAYEGDAGIDYLPAEWGGNGFLLDNTTIYEIEITNTDGTYSPISHYNSYSMDYMKYDNKINWGDGTPAESLHGVHGATSGAKTHKYNNPGTYYVKAHAVLGLDRQSSFSGIVKKVLQVAKYYRGKPCDNLKYALKNCPKLTFVDFSNLDFSAKGVNCNEVFENCPNLKTVILPKNFKNSYAGGMFNACKNLTEIINHENMDMSECSTTLNMFKNCSSLASLDVSKWGMGGILNTPGYGTGYMFDGCINLTSLDVSNWDNSTWYSCDYIFKNTGLYTIDISNWTSTTRSNTGGAPAKRTNLLGMFRDCSNLTEVIGLESIIGEDIKSLSSLFYNCPKLKSINLGSGSTGNIKDISYLAYGCTALESVNLSRLSFSKETTEGSQTNKINLAAAFYNCTSLNTVTMPSEKIAAIEGQTIDMGNMFYNCTSLRELNISKITLNTDDVVNAMLQNVPSDSHIIAKSSFGKTESDCGWTGTFDLILVGMFAKFKGTSTEAKSYEPSDFKINEEYSSDYTIIINPEANEDGTYNVSICTLDEDIKPSKATFKNNAAITSIEYFDTSEITDMAYQFYSCNNLETVNAVGWKLKGTASYFFSACKKLSSITGIDSWDTTEATTLAFFFDGCEVLTDDAINGIKNWRFPLNVSLRRFFYQCSTLTKVDLTGWVTPNVNMMDKVFLGCSNLTEIKGIGTWGTNKTTSTSSMFYGCGKLTLIEGIENFYVDRVENMEQMFNTCFALETIDFSNWNTPSLSTAKGLFKYCYNLKNIIGIDRLNISKVSSLVEMFFDCKSLETIDISSWNFSLVDSVTNLFSGCLKLSNINMGDLFTRENCNVKDLSGMFKNCTSLTSIPGIENWNTSSFEKLYETFSGCTALTSLEGFENLVRENVTSIGNIFYGCSNITSLEPLANWNTSKVQSMSYAFYKCSNITSLEPLANWNTSKVDYMMYTFYRCTSLTSLNGLQNWQLGNLKNLECAFYQCTSLTSISALLNWKVSKVTSVDSAFRGCNSLISLDGLQNWQTTSLVVMSGFIRDCPLLTSVDELTGWNVEKVTVMDSLFKRDIGLTSVTAMKNWNLTTSLYNISDLFSGCQNLELIDLRAFNTGNISYCSAALAEVPTTCTVVIDRNIFKRTPSQVSWKGTFTDVTEYVEAGA